MTQAYIEGAGLSYGDMERQGFSQSFIEDYQAIRRSLTPLTGTEVNPNSKFNANESGWYVDTSTPGLWYNPSPGSKTGWIQLV